MLFELAVIKSCLKHNKIPRWVSEDLKKHILGLALDLDVKMTVEV